MRQDVNQIVTAYKTRLQELQSGGDATQSQHSLSRTETENNTNEEDDLEKDVYTKEVNKFDEKCNAYCNEMSKKDKRQYVSAMSKAGDMDCGLECSCLFKKEEVKHKYTKGISGCS